jgi:hypothetical protein
VAARQRCDRALAAALSQIETGRASVIKELFYVTARITNLHGYKNVYVIWFVAERARPLFGPDGSLGIPYERVITDYNATDESRHYCEGAVEELFTDDEAKAFVEFLRTHRDDAYRQIEIVPHSLPIARNQMGHGPLAVGGKSGFLRIGESDDYDLSFGVWGYYDLRIGNCEFDETLPGAHRMRRGYLVHPDGDVEPWLLDDPPKTN